MTHEARDAAVIDRAGLEALFDILRERGYTLLGPRVEEGTAIVLGEIASTADLPAGWQDEQAPGHYRVGRTDSASLFSHAVGPQAWKSFLFPAERPVWSLRLRDGVFEPVPRSESVPRYALIGARSCDLHAMAIQDRVFSGQAFHDDDYSARHDAAFVVAVNCGQAASTCFCASLGSGPRCAAGFDLALTEWVDGDDHAFLVECGTEAGSDVLGALPSRPVTAKDRARADAIVAATGAAQTRRLDADAVPALLARNLEHPHWEEIASRCLACGSCTLACPTCFCSDFVDTADVTGTVAERRQQWSSCFNAAFSYTHGGSVRASTAARYRQWLTHKLSTWVEQFDSLGCVGCGRCITWCPVGIDLTAEVAAIAATDSAKSTSRTTAAETGT